MAPQRFHPLGVYPPQVVLMLCKLCSLLLFCLAGMSTLVARAGAQTISEQYLLTAANRERAERGLPQVRIDMHLVEAARFHAAQMVRHADISHQFAGEPDLAKRAGDAGARFSLVSENVAEASNAALIHDLWMQSPGHRANLLDPKVDSIGVAVYQSHGQLYAVEDFARVVAQLSYDDQENRVASLLAPAGVALSTGTSDARRTCSMDTGFAGQRQPWFVMRYTSGDLNQLPRELTEKLATGRYHQASVGACAVGGKQPFSAYSIAVLLYP